MTSGNGISGQVMLQLGQTLANCLRLIKRARCS